MVTDISVIGSRLPAYRPYTNIQPFTVRDGATYLLVLEGLREWLNDQLVPHVDKEISELIASWEGNTSELITTVEQKIAEVIALVNTAVEGVNEDAAAAIAAKAAAEAARDLAEQYASQAEAVQDQAVASIFLEATSLLRNALDSVYVSLADYTPFKTLTTSDIAALKNDKVNTTTYDTFKSSVESRLGTIEPELDRIDNVKAEKSVTDPVVSAVTTGRLSEASINALVGDGYNKALIVERNGKYPPATIFKRLQDGAYARTSTNTRVVVVGDSHAVGGYTTFIEQGMFQRLAYRSGAKAYRALSDLTTPIPAGVQWYTAAVGGRVSANYVSSTDVSRIATVNPQYVMHMVGSNDYSNNIGKASYKANVLAAINAIDAVAPNTIHVLIFGQNRGDVTPTTPWSAYGEALSELAEASPSDRVYIDANAAFELFALNGDNYDGILLPDRVHMGNVGHKFMADVLSQYMGLPIETRFDTAVDVRAIPLPTFKTYSAASVESRIDIQAAAYPRIAKISGPWYVTSTSPSGEIATRLRENDVPLEQINFRLGTTAAHTRGIDCDIYIPSGKNVILEVLVLPAGGTITLEGDANYYRAKVSIEPV